MPPSPRDHLGFPRLIVCEGATDEAFFRALIKHRGLPKFCVRHNGDFDRRGVGGRSKFAQFLRGLPAWHGFYSLQSIILVGDNDTNPTQNFDQIQAQVRNTKLSGVVPPVQYGVPTAPMQFEPGSPAKLAIIMLPSPGVAGCLENLCLTAAASVDAATNVCVDQFAICTGADKWQVPDRAKFELQANLSARNEDNPTIWLGSQWHEDTRTRLVPLSHPCFDPLETFLRSA